MNSKNKIYIAGHNGMVGSAIVRQLQTKLNNTAQLITRTHQELDLTNQQQVDNFIAGERPNQIYLAAAKVGGIHANNIYPADFIYQNLMIQANIIHAAHKNNIQKLLFLGSSCIYPKSAKQPMKEEMLLTGILEPTNEPYAIAKIAGIKLCESYNRQYSRDYRSVMPTNLYGPGDNYHPKNSHVIPALIRKFHEAKSDNASKVTIWGSGKPKREFLYVDDMASACVYVMNLDKEVYQQQVKPMQSHINVGTGQDLTIKQLAEGMAKVIGFKGKIEFDISKSDGTKRKLMDSTRLNSLGWRPKIDLEQGIKQTYKDYCINSNR
jgi:GDP-L-fucose synthase